MTNNKSKPSTSVNSNSFSTSNSFREYPPKLTDEEHCLLMDHGGCLKCRNFTQGTVHISVQSQFLAKNYRTLTIQDAQCAMAFQSGKNANNSQNNAVATITDANTSQNQTEDFIAAVFPSLSSSAVGDSSFLEGSDNSFASVSASPHIKSKHFIWDCSLTGPKVVFPVIKPA